MAIKKLTPAAGSKLVGSARKLHTALDNLARELEDHGVNPKNARAARDAIERVSGDVNKATTAPTK